jgi:hypothetical protein
MDVSTSLDDDPKFRTLARRHPDLLAVAGWAYIGLLARSWREGERLTLEEAWPALLPWDQGAADAMVAVGLVDEHQRLPEHAWDAWYGAAAERRRLGRERQRRADARRGRSGRQADSQGQQAGSTDSPSVSQSGPTRDQRGSNVGPSDDEPSKGRTNGRIGIVPSEGPCRVCGGYLSDKDLSRVGPGWIEHAEHPAEWTGATA